VDDNWDACLSFVLEAEGGYTDDPVDPGGATNLGITLDELARWRRSDVSKDDVRALGRDEAGEIYHANYWRASRCPELPAGVDLMVFDASVNTGLGRSARLLQQAVGTSTDGIIGPHTMAAVSAADASKLVSTLYMLRCNFYKALPTFWHFGDGWLSRTLQARQTALHLIHS
jgi:lysozyme family protein